MILIGRVRSLTVTALTGGLSLALLLAAAAACGGDGGTTAAVPKTSASAAPQGAFRECLRQHGVTLPEQGRRAQGGGPPSGRPTGRPSDFPSLSPSRRQAVRACASLAPNGGRFGGIDQSALKAFQSCMSRHGVKVTSSFRPGALRTATATATADPKAAAAFRTCRALLPRRPAGRTSPSPSAGPS